MTDRSESWRSTATEELRNAQAILDGFEHDPPVLISVIRTAASRHRKALAICALGLVALGIFAIAHALP